MRALRGSRGSHTSRAALAAPRGSIPSGSDVTQSLCGAGPCGSTRVLEEAGGSKLQYRVLFSCVVSDTALCMAWVHAGPAQGGSIVCVAARRGATRVLRSSRVSHAGHAALAASRVHSIRKRCGPIVWRGTTRVLEEARERVWSLESWACVVTCVVCDTARGSTRVLRRSFAGSRAVYGWLSKLWSLFGSLLYYGA